MQSAYPLADECIQNDRKMQEPSSVHTHYAVQKYIKTLEPTNFCSVIFSFRSHIITFFCFSDAVYIVCLWTTCHTATFGLTIQTTTVFSFTDLPHSFHAMTMGRKNIAHSIWNHPFLSVKNFVYDSANLQKFWHRTASILERFLTDYSTLCYPLLSIFRNQSVLISVDFFFFFGKN